MLSYLFWPNNGTTPYSSTSVATFLVVCVLFIIISYYLRKWISKQSNKQTRKLTKSWPSILQWYGFIGVVLAVSRAEGILYLSMRIWWILWGATFVAIAILQWRKFTNKHYTVVEEVKVNDPRDKYLPKKKRS
jgi:preprotein translocase subunit YajC